MPGVRRYGEFGIRLAIGESKRDVYKSLIAEAVLIGLAGSVIGTILALGFGYWMQEVGFDFSGFFKQSTMLISSVLRARVTPASYYIGFFPGLLATFIGASIAGIGIFKRQTSQLFKELEA